MPDAYDDIVVGVGGAGSSIVHHLAKSGRKVLALEQFNIAHDSGSSHGLSRIIRLAYPEGPAYVPLLKRAYELWHDLESESKEKLLTKTGCLNIGPPGSLAFEGCLSSARRFGLAHEVLDSQEVMSRYPGFSLPENMKAVFQPDGGFLEPERCIVAYVTQALKLGAEVHARERVRSWDASDSEVSVSTDRGTYRSKRIVFSAGAWSSKLVQDIGIPLVPERQVVGWFRPLRPVLFEIGNLPVWIIGRDDSPFSAYGFPMFGIPGFKLGIMHHRREVVDPDDYDRAPNEEDEKLLRAFMKEYFPLADGPTLALTSCIFTNTPDGDFLLDFHPKHRNVIVVSCCSGHGFKFCSVVGEIVKELSIEGKTRHDIDLFSIRSHLERMRGD